MREYPALGAAVTEYDSGHAGTASVASVGQNRVMGATFLLLLTISPPPLPSQLGSARLGLV